MAKRVEVISSTKGLDGGVAMPIATAVWFLVNTNLTFEQIGDFCKMHPLEVQTLGGSSSVLPISPVGVYVTEEEIARCEKDKGAFLNKKPISILSSTIKRPKLREYVPVLQRRNRFDAALWLIRFHPSLTDSQVAGLVHSTVKVVGQIRNGVYSKIESLIPKSPVVLGLCTKKQLDEAIG